MDGKRFSSKAALTQHRRDAHGSGLQARATQRRPQREALAPMGGAAPVALPMNVRGVQSDVARMSGVDRIFNSGDVRSWSAGSRVMDLLVVPSIFPRLKLVSEAFQRIRYVQLILRVEPQMPTSTAGGYVVAFVRDPADLVDNIFQLTAQQGSITTKWWQSSRIAIPPPNRLFFTSASSEIREFSPGRIVIMVDGVATQVGSLTVFCDWRVELSSAGLENPKQISKQPVVLMDLLIKSGHKGLFGRKTPTSQIDVTDITLQISGAKQGKYYAIPPVTVNSAANQTKIIHWLWCYSGNDLFVCYDSVNDVETGAFTQQNLVLRAGTILADVTPVPVSGEVRAPPSSVLPTEMVALLQQFGPLAKLFEALEIKSLSPSTSSLEPLLTSEVKSPPPEDESV